MKNHASLELRAPAKLNLHLRVVGRRADGYHFLEMLLVKLDLCDRLMMSLTGSGIGLEVRGADLPAGEDNLVVRAARAFFQRTGVRPGVDLVLEKRIPVAAGLGGGSSDAAATLLGLNQCHGGLLGPEDLLSLGLSLGADVPFFLQSHDAARASGIGEIFRAGPEMGPLFFLLVNPGWPLSTAEVFREFNLELTFQDRDHIFTGLNERSFTIARALHNDLETVVLPRYPEVKRIKDQLINAGAEGALMTGSGATVFGVFSSPRSMERAHALLEDEKEKAWIVIPTMALHTRIHSVTG